MDLRARSNCYCGHSYSKHVGTTFDDDGFCHERGCDCDTYRPDPFDLPVDSTFSNRYVR